jgi:hypothetical protein
MSATSGVFVAFSIAFIMPLPDEPEALTTGLWRVIFIGPALIAITMIILFLFVFRYDTPVFYKRKGDMKNYNKIMSLIYREHKSEGNINIKAVVPVNDEDDDDQPSNRHLNDGEEIRPSAIIDVNENKEISTPEKLVSRHAEFIETEQNINEVKEEAEKEFEKEFEEVEEVEEVEKVEKVVTKSNSWPAHYKKGLIICSIISC